MGIISEKKDIQTESLAPATIPVPGPITVIDILEDAVVLSGTLDNGTLLKRLYQAKILLNKAKEIENAISCEVARRIKSSGAINMKIDNLKVNLIEESKLEFNTDILKRVAGHLSEDEYAKTHNKKIEWNWEQLKKLARSNREIRKIVKEGVKEKNKSNTVKIEISR